MCGTSVGRVASVPERALIHLDREVYGLVSGMSGWRLKIVNALLQEGQDTNIYEPVCSARSSKRTKLAYMETPLSGIPSWEVCYWQWTTT